MESIARRIPVLLQARRQWRFGSRSKDARRLTSERRRSARSARSSGTRFASGNADPSLVAFGGRVTRDDRTRSVTDGRNRTIREPDRRPRSQPSTNEWRTRDTSHDVSKPPGESLSVDIGRRPESLSLDRSLLTVVAIRSTGSMGPALPGEFERTTGSRAPLTPEPCVGNRYAADKSHTTILNSDRPTRSTQVSRGRLFSRRDTRGTAIGSGGRA